MRAIFYRVKSRRSQVIYEAWRAGLAKHGIALPAKREEERRGIEADLVIHYGLWGTLRTLAAECAASGAKAVFCDLGYWGRIEGGKLAGYHRVAVNAQHATAYFQKIKHGPERFRRFGIQTQPFRREGSHVLLCGMSAKAAWVYGLGPEEWERGAAAKLTAGGREVWYRPKPSWKHSSPIAGTVWRGNRDQTREPIEHDLVGAWALATHHGNTALDALAMGIPVFCENGLASALAERDLAKIVTPRIPNDEERDQLLYDAAWTQYSIAEITEGRAWQYLKEECLL